jgi:hypothetical protein
MAAKEVVIKSFGLDLKVKNKGLELGVYDGKKFLGDLFITKTGLIWCKGKTDRDNGVPVSWAEFTEWMESP